MLELDPAIEQSFVPPDRLIFASPAGSFTIIDKTGLIRALLDCLRDGLPVERAFEQIEDPAQRQAISDRIVDVLRTRRVIREKDPVSDCHKEEDSLSDWLRFVGSGHQHTPHVGVIGDGTLAQALQEELCALGLSNSTPDHIDKSCDLIIHCQDYEDMSGLRAANKRAVEAGVPYLPVWVRRHVIALGPVIIPGATACMECVHHRGRMNQGDAMNDSAACRQPATSGFVLRFGAMLAGAEASRFLFGAAYELHVATLKRYSVLTGKQAHSVILKLPRCPVCGIGRAERPLVDTFALQDDQSEMLEPAE